MSEPSAGAIRFAKYQAPKPLIYKLEDRPRTIYVGEDVVVESVVLEHAPAPVQPDVRNDWTENSKVVVEAPRANRQTNRS